MNPNMPSSGRVDVQRLMTAVRLDMQAAAAELAVKRPKLRDSLHANADQVGALAGAVAELIEALRLCRDELIGIDGHITDPDNPDGWTDGDLYAAYAKACAALVRCGGTK